MPFFDAFALPDSKRLKELLTKSARSPCKLLTSSQQFPRSRRPGHCNQERDGGSSARVPSEEPIDLVHCRDSLRVLCTGMSGIQQTQYIHQNPTLAHKVGRVKRRVSLYLKCTRVQLFCRFFLNILARSYTPASLCVLCDEPVVLVGVHVGRDPIRL